MELRVREGESVSEGEAGDITVSQKRRDRISTGSGLFENL
jgi:hypothetical protein